mmetsp:Transcript_29133/g.44464  ORF Transcript_29133/g.44464 Transcript_29133/m.44464 type:complete len:81 (-) Transcript_29133:975-1217(-)
MGDDYQLLICKIGTAIQDDAMLKVFNDISIRKLICLQQNMRSTLIVHDGIDAGLINPPKGWNGNNVMNQFSIGVGRFPVH